MNKTITIDKDGFVLLSAFYSWVDTNKVEYYKIKLNKDKTIAIKFYDKNKKLVKPHVK